MKRHGQLLPWQGAQPQADKLGLHDRPITLCLETHVSAHKIIKLSVFHRKKCGYFVKHQEKICIHEGKFRTCSTALLGTKIFVHTIQPSEAGTRKCFLLLWFIVSFETRHKRKCIYHTLFTFSGGFAQRYSKYSQQKMNSFFLTAIAASISSCRI